MWNNSGWVGTSHKWRKQRDSSIVVIAREREGTSQSIFWSLMGSLNRQVSRDFLGRGTWSGTAEITLTPFRLSFTLIDQRTGKTERREDWAFRGTEKEGRLHNVVREGKLRSVCARAAMERGRVKHHCATNKRIESKKRLFRSEDYDRRRCECFLSADIAARK